MLAPIIIFLLGPPALILAVVIALVCLVWIGIGNLRSYR